MNWKNFGCLVVGILVIGIGACGEDEIPSEEQAAYELEDEGAVCFGTSNPWDPETGVTSGTSTTLRLYIDESMVSDAEAGFAGECEITVDDGEIIVDNGVFVPNEDSSYFDEAASPYSAECSEITLEEKNYTVRVGESVYELDLSQTEEDGGESSESAPGVTCLGLGEEIVEENTAELCVRPIEEDDTNIDLVAQHELGATSCIDAYDLECDVQKEDGDYSVTMVANYRSYAEIAESAGNACTADLQFSDVDCGALDLEEGSYEFAYGDELLEFDVPVEDDVCVR